MAIDRQVQHWLEVEDFDALEVHWLARLEEDPEDLDFAIGAARALAGHHEHDRARNLLELWDQELIEHEHWAPRLQFLRRSQLLLFGSDRLHREIERSLQALYPEHPRLGALIERVGLHRAVDDTDKLWTKTDRLLSILPFEFGAAVAMSGRGVGRILDVNVELESYKVEFADGSSLMVGFRAAAKSLTLLAPEHVLRRKLEDPESLRSLAASDPTELLRLVLTSFGQPLTAGEIREALDGIVGAGAWNSWWNTARRHPQVLHRAQGRGVYSWAESTEDAEESQWLAFEKADGHTRIDLLRRAGDRAPALAARMVAALCEQVAARAGDPDGEALEIALALRRLARGTGGFEPPDPAALLAAAGDVPTQILAIPDRPLREEAYGLLPAARPRDWLEIAGILFRREEDPKGVAVLGDQVATADPERLNRWIEDVLSQPRKAPAAFLWLLDQARADAAWRQRSPLRLLKQFLQALEWDEFKGSRVALQTDLESGGLVARLIPELDADQAAQALLVLKRAPIADFLRTPLVNALQLRHPGLASAPRSVQPLYALPVSIAAKREELRNVLEVEIPANRKAIQEAREMGDLRENFEYKAARQRHEYLTARAAELQGEIERTRPIERQGIEPDQIRIGTTAALRDAAGAMQQFTILGPWESAPEEGILSHESELAQRLLGQSPGARVQVDGCDYTVESVAVASQLLTG